MMDSEPSIHSAFTHEMLLYRAYMPHVKGGGLFIRTRQVFEFGSHVQLGVQLLNEPESYWVQGLVIWVTPEDAQSNKPAGIGIQFLGEKARQLREKIETYLSGMINSNEITDTV